MIKSDGERADILSKRRARMLPILAIIYLSQQASFFSDHASQRLDHFKVGSWVVLSALLLALLTTKGFWFRKAEVRNMIDDEGTRANRSAGLQAGFVVAMISGIILYFIDQFEPMAAREVIHVIVSLGLAAALIRFGMLERRDHRG
jgi:hypothetical protein